MMNNPQKISWMAVLLISLVSLPARADEPPAGVVTLVNRQTGGCATSSSWGGELGQNVRNVGCDSDPNGFYGARQRWRLVPHGDGSYYISGAYGHCFGIAYSATYQGAKVVNWSCVNGSGDQRYWFTHLGGGYYRIQPVHSWMALDIDYGGTNPYYNDLIQWPWGGWLNQQWLVKPDAVAQCNVPVSSASGGDAPYSARVQLGKTSGVFRFSYNTYGIQDRMVVRYQGTVLHDSGCVGTTNAAVNLSYSGTDAHATVEVYPNCAGTTGTQWDFVVSCP